MSGSSRAHVDDAAAVAQPGLVPSPPHLGAAVHARTAATPVGVVVGALDAGLPNQGLAALLGSRPAAAVPPAIDGRADEVPRSRAIELGAPASATLSRQGAQAPPAAAPGSVAGQADAAVGAPTTGHQIEVNVTIPGGQSLATVAGSPPKEVHTSADVNVRVVADGTGIRVSFSPGMMISTRNPEFYIPDVDIQVDALGWTYGTPTQQLSVAWTARRIVNWVGDPGGDILAAMSARWAALPTRVQAGGYDPFRDPALPGDLMTFARGLAAGGGGSSAPKVLARDVQAEVTLAAEIARDVGDGVKLVVPSGSRITIRAFLDGDLTASPPVIKVTSISLSVGGNRASINLRALGQDWPVVAVSDVRVAFGGAITASYTIIHEDLGTGLLQLLAALAIAENPANAERIRDDLTFRDAAAHRKVDAMVAGKLEPMFADVIRANAGAIPGVNLLDVFGIPAR